MTEKNTMALVPAEHEMMVYQNMAKQAVESKFYRNYGDTSAVITIMLAARELGITPMAALNGGLNIIQGKVEISARMMNALIRRAGHSITTLKSNNEICELKGKRCDNGDEDIASFSIEDAKNAGLMKPGGGWSKYPTDMLYARTLSRLARRLFPDVIGCAYVEGEIFEPAPSKEELKHVSEDVKVVDEFPIDFVKQFDKEEQMYISDYIKKVNEHYDLSYSGIIEKYNADPDKFMQKVENWKKQIIKKTAIQ